MSRKWINKGWTNHVVSSPPRPASQAVRKPQTPNPWTIRFHSTLVHFLEKSSAQGVGDLKDSTQHALGQRIQLIGVHWRSSAAKLKCRPNTKALENNSSAADKRRSTPIFVRNRGTRPVQLIPGHYTSITTLSARARSRTQRRTRNMRRILSR